MADYIGWIGSIAFAVCGAPQAWACYRRGHAEGISLAFISLWLIGEICYVFSVLAKFGFISWMMFNYNLNIIFALVILYYIVRPRRNRHEDPRTRGLPSHDPADARG